jgi:hypothetical protein
MMLMAQLHSQAQKKSAMLHRAISEIAYMIKTDTMITRLFKDIQTHKKNDLT